VQASIVELSRTVIGPYWHLALNIYCFKDNLNWALSFALDRSWPFEDSEGKHSRSRKDNPSIVLFPEGPTDVSNFFHVDTERLDENLAQKMQEGEYDVFRTKADK
jgi:hypothetical protein